MNSPTIDTPQSFADYTKFDVNYIYQISHIKDFPCFRTGRRGRIRIKREDAIRWLEEKTKSEG